MSDMVGPSALAPAVRLAGRGWGWWTGELAAMVPARFRGRDRRPQLTIRPGPDSVAVERTINDERQLLLDPHTIEALDDDSWAQLREFTNGAITRVIISPPECFTTSVRLPRAARGRLHAAVALQLGEIAPLEPDALVWSTHTVVLDGEALTVKVTMARRTRVEALTALFAERGLPAPAIAAAAGDDVVPLVLGDAPRAGGGRRQWGIAAALVASIPVTTMVIAAILTANADNDSTLLEQTVAPMLAHDRQARAAERTRVVLAPLVAQPAAATILAHLATTLPASSFVQIVEAHGNRLALTIDTGDPDAAQAALRGDPLLTQLRLQGATPGEDGRSELSLSGPLAAGTLVFGEVAPRSLRAGTLAARPINPLQPVTRR